MPIVGQDLFTEASNTNLENHTADVGGGWSVSTTGVLVVQAAEDNVSASGTLDRRARKGDDIGDDDMDVSADVKTTTNTSRLAGVLARASTDGFNNQYEAFVIGNGAGNNPLVQLFKVVSGTPTQLGSIDCGVAASTFMTLKCAIRAGTQEVFINAVSKISATEADTTLQDRRYAGLVMNGAGSADCRLDNFLSESVADASAAGVVAAAQLLASSGMIGRVYG